MKGTTVMKQAQRFALVAILASSFAAVSPSHAQMGGMDMKDMDMEKCKGMDMSKCKDMMGKDKKGMEMQGMGADKKSEAKSHKGVGTVKKVDPASSKVTIARGRPVFSIPVRCIRKSGRSAPAIARYAAWRWSRWSQAQKPGQTRSSSI